MNIEDDKEGFYSVFLNDYTDEEVNTFVKCIMSNNIKYEDILRCITGIGVSIGLDLERYEVYSEVVSEDDSEDEEPQTSSEFEDFLNGSIDLLIYDKAFKTWVKAFKDLLIKKEKYELLHILKLEKTWNI